MSDKTFSGQNPFVILTQFVKDVSFENILVRNSNAPSIDEDPEIKVNALVSTKEHPQMTGTYEVELAVSVTAEYKTQKIFIAEATNTAVIQFNDEFVKDHSDYIDPTMCIEIPFYLFFEIRNLIANLSNMGGYPPVFIRPVDFAAMYQEKLQNSSMTKH